MEAMILGRDYRALCIIDAFESFIWADRYNEPGDFEIYMPIAKAPLNYIQRENYLWIRDSDRLQIIEDITIKTDAEEGDHITFVGRTLESILERRVVYQKTTIKGSLQSGIQRLLNENAINPSDPSRKLPMLRFVQNNDSRITKLTMDATFLGEDLLDIVQTYCQLYELGFKIVFNEKNSTFDFSLYYGEDRSYNQEKLPWVVFSSAYNNLIGSNYFESYKNLRTAAVVIGEENEDYGQEVVTLDQYPKLKGLDRREMAVDAGSITWDVEEPDEDAIRDKYRQKIEEDIRNSEWANTHDEEEIQERIERRVDRDSADEIKRAWDNAIETARLQLRSEMEQAGKEELAETYITKTFEGEIEAVRQYVYGIDFFIGDVVQVRNQYGKEASSRITEVVRSHDVDGYKLTPTFTTLIGSDNEGDITKPEL